MADIKHVFVLMLENRSFDHMFGLSGIPGIQAATNANTNSYLGKTYPFGGGAPDPMPSDPHHGFCNVLTQLAGQGADCSRTSPYPARTNSGFVADYATTQVRSGLLRRKRPLPPADWGKAMLAIETRRETPALYTLASQYALCDQWYSSLPGPTWPNRFFVHGASSGGLADAPGRWDILKWEIWGGFIYPKGSIFDRLGAGNYQLYQDRRGPLSGRIPQVAALRGISLDSVRSLDLFDHDLHNAYSARYTFIEPAYGDVVFDTYRGGSSQHPMDGLASGDGLVARVYNAIRNSDVWESSLLIITFDEHGGFYDSAVPADAAPPPGDGAGLFPNRHGFNFSAYGVRVPAVIVSPWIAKGRVDHTLYDHSSVLATVERLFDLDPLTDRDAKANDLLHLATDILRPDEDCPTDLTEEGGAEARFDGEEPTPASPDEPIENGSNLQSFLFVVRKADREKISMPLALARYQTVNTRGQAQRYIEEVMSRLVVSGPMAGA